MLISCGGDDEHTHDFSMWNTTTQPSCTTQGTQSRFCNSCGFTEYSQIPATGHTEVVDLAIPETCTENGKTSGTHCGNCGTIIKAQTTITATGHTPVIDSEIPATCTVDGKTEGKHCSTCKTTLIEQKLISAPGHSYNEGEIINEATCVQDGTKKYTCTISSCKHTYTGTYSLPTYTATELYNQSIKYVGEIVTYNKDGDEYSLGTGFVISSDGKIVTNYHILEKAYSATITIDGITHKIISLLAYDETIDLAVLKINATELTAAKVCKNHVSVGDTIYAIGSSRGMTNTYSQGIVTYANRVVDGVSHIQHDASITHGNSGGPLINTHGEIIGINTWGISDSQNLNFAVFAGELDKLTYGESITLSEFYLQNFDVYEKLKNFIINSGSYDADYNCYSVVLDTSYSSDYAVKFTRLAYYYIDDDEITLDYVINNGEVWAYFVIDEIDGTYEWSFFDDYDNKMSGTLYATTYSSDSLLGYSYNNISSSTDRADIRELASSMISVLCAWIDDDFAEINVTAEDLYFYYY